MQKPILTGTTGYLARGCRPGAYVRPAQPSLMALSRPAISALPIVASRQFRRRDRGNSPSQHERSRSPGRSMTQGMRQAPRHMRDRLQQEFSEVPDKVTLTPPSQSVFAHDSTFELCKKLFIYRLMGSELFINYSLLGIRMAYGLLGRRLTNYAIENTAASVFTGGVTVGDLMNEVGTLEKRGVGSIGCYVVEGVRDARNKELDQFMDFSIRSINEITEGRTDGHFALKLTAYISTDVMEKLAQAQRRFVSEILEVRFDARNNSVLSEDELKANLAHIGVVDFSRQDFDSLVNYLQAKTKSNQMSNISRYTNGHLFNVYGERTSLTTKIAKALGDLSDKDLANYDLFADRVRSLGSLANDRNCHLYIDAEQSFIQSAIESFGQQMTHQLNAGDKNIVMNGYQCYLKRMASTIPMEVRASQEAGYNLGIKLIRGAYMNEERELAAEQGHESPVWDTIEGTHNCYNGNMTHIIEEMTDRDMLFVASHNLDSCETAMELVEERGLEERVRFGQLKGFSDQVTNEIGGRGFQVFKYLPFGPTEQVMPYLVRRGQESKQVVREQQFQNTFLKREIFSRFKF